MRRTYGQLGQSKIVSFQDMGMDSSLYYDFGIGGGLL